MKSRKRIYMLNAAMFIDVYLWDGDRKSGMMGIEE